MGKIQKNDLGFLGADYQYKLVSAFIDDHKFFKDIYSVIEHNAFTEPCLRGIVGIMKDYYDEYETIPSYETLSFKAAEKLIRNEEDKQYYDETFDKLRHTSPEAREEVETLGLKFFRQQEVILRSNELLKASSTGADLDELEEHVRRIVDAVSVKRHKIEITSPFQSIDEDTSKNNVVCIPTGIGPLDDVLGGGLEKGKIGLIIGPTGFGKTSMTTCFGGNAALAQCEANNYEGFKVLQIVFEDSHRDIHRKYISKLTGVETADINKDESTTEQVRRILRESLDRHVVDNNVRIVRLESGEYSVSDIKKMIINDFINEGFKPDLVIIDYFECIAPEAGMSKLDVTERESKTMRKLENLAPELDIAIWIPTQGNRESLVSELVTADKMGGSIRKGQIAQVIISIAKTEEQKKQNRANIALLKQRGGRDTITFENAIFNNGTCFIDCSQVEDFDSVLGFNELASTREKELEKEMILRSRAEFKLRQK